MSNYSLREMVPADEDRVLEIYKQGIDAGISTFETEVPNKEVWNNTYYQECRWIIENEANYIIGWAALKPVGQLDWTRGVAEVSVYIDSEFLSKGFGTILLERMIIDSEKKGFWMLQSAVFPENIASLKVHQKLGFRVVGTRERIGQLNGVWKDIVLLERRSLKMGL